MFLGSLVSIVELATNLVSSKLNKELTYYSNNLASKQLSKPITNIVGIKLNRLNDNDNYVYNQQ